MTRKIHSRVASAALVALMLAGCTVEPESLTPTLSLNPDRAMLASTGDPGCSAYAIRAMPAVLNMSDADAKHSDSNLAGIEAEITTLTGYDPKVHKLTGEGRLATVNADLPTALNNNKVILSVARLMILKNLLTTQALVESKLKSQQLGLTDNDRDSLDATLKAAINSMQPGRLHYATVDLDLLTRNDFRDLFDKLFSPSGSTNTHRIAQYETYYFNGTFVDRFGTGLTKPSPSLTVTDAEITGAVTVLLEAVADDIFDKTPVWTGTGADAGSYFPGDNKNKPSFLQFADDNNEAELTVALQPSGCAMTPLKMKVLAYLAGKASVWASGEAGLIMGTAGGINAGPAIVLGKLSIGDNKLLEDLVQTVMSYAAQRATFEAAGAILLKIDQPPETNKQTSDLWALIDQFVFDGGSN